MAPNQSNIRYRYAINGSGDIVNIFDLTEEDRKDYTCLGCGQILRPAMGKVRKSHFRHKVVGNCSVQTYLHRMGVWLFQEAYQECLVNKEPFYLEEPLQNICKSCQDGPCPLNTSTAIIDLTKSYPSSIEEKHDHIESNIFIPDILLCDSHGKKIYVEIAVSHKSTEKKIGTDIPIIEIDIYSEEDFDLILSKRLSHKDIHVSLINFQEKISEVDYSDRCAYYRARKLAEQLDREVKCKIKAIFEKTIREKRSFYVVISRPVECNACPGTPCHVSQSDEEIDFTKFFSCIVEEPPGPEETNNRLAIVSDSGRKIYFETRGVFRRRKNLEEFIDSRIEMMELDIVSPDLLTDMDKPNSHKLHYVFHNINPKPISIKVHEKCNNRINVFIVNKSGRARIEWMTIYKYFECQKNSSGYVKEVDSEGHETFIREVEAAFSSGVAIKNCYLCRYHSGANHYQNFERKGSGGIFCKHLKITCGSNQAAKCEFYRPDKSVFGTERYPQRRRW